ncbi:hypothetical protein [Chitinophaga sp.]|uniref:hypothetical protein n=1 Tax=Chitinophaga sp. TaxID=1869181 RepID=UPI002F95F5A2
MKNETPVNPMQVNILLDIHTKLADFPVMFRERVCEECNWSAPTFYRKMRGKDKPSPNDKRKIISVLSNAEKQKIMEVLEDGFMNVAEKCQKYMKKVHIIRNKD